jgi:SAM-dependent methyltransferase
MIASEILGFSAAGKEERRLSASIGRLEFVRTWEILERYLPASPSRVVDIGGGTGVYALPLASRGHQVHLVDPVPLHVERATASSSASPTPLETVRRGDARRLPASDAAFDVALMFGPLYHLTTRADRVRARDRLLAVLRRVEAEPSLLGASAHLVAVARA